MKATVPSDPAHIQSFQPRKRKTEVTSITSNEAGIMPSQASRISWANRNRGRVQRMAIAKAIRRNILKATTPNWIRPIHQGPEAGRSQPPKGFSDQPPRNSIVKKAAPVIMWKYSARKKIAKRIEEMFEELDEDLSGDVDADEFHDGLRGLGLTLTVKEAEDITKRFPSTGKNAIGPKGPRIRYRDFVAAVRGKAPASHEAKDSQGDRVATYAVRKLAEEVERCSRT